MRLHFKLVQDVSVLDWFVTSVMSLYISQGDLSGFMPSVRQELLTTVSMYWDTVPQLAKSY